MTGTVWVGVDPGARWTGICSRIGLRLIGWRVIDLHDTEPDATRPGRLTLDLIVDTVRTLGGVGCRVAIEDTQPPNSHHQGRVSIIQVEPLLRAAEIVGYVEAACPQAVRVRPNGHGHRALASYVQYAPDLVSAAELGNATRKRKLMAPAPQNSVLRHARSAWDVAGAGLVEDRVTAALASAAARRSTN